MDITTIIINIIIIIIILMIIIIMIIVIQLLEYVIPPPPAAPAPELLQIYTVYVCWNNIFGVDGMMKSTQCLSDIGGNALFH